MDRPTVPPNLSEAKLALQAMLEDIWDVMGEEHRAFAQSVAIEILDACAARDMTMAPQIAGLAIAMVALLDDAVRRVCGAEWRAK